MAKRTEVVLAGLAGQGLVSAGVILADAVGLLEDKFVSHLGFYGTSVRTGPSRAEVVVGEEEIDFPAATCPDIVVAFTQSDAKSFGHKMRPGSILIVDSDQEVTGLSESPSVYRLPFLNIAKEQLGEELLLNMVALGAVAAISSVVSIKSLEQTVANQFRGSRGKKNLEALREGYNVGLLAQPVHIRASKGV